MTAPTDRPRGWLTAFLGIARRETLRFVNQRGRFLAALVRPLVWLFIFAAGFRAVLGLSIVIMIMLIASSGLETLIAAPAVAAWDSTAVNWTSAIEVLIASNLSWWAYTGAMVRNSPSARSSLWPASPRDCWRRRPESW